MSSLLEAAAQNLYTAKKMSRPVCFKHCPAVMSAAGSTVCTQRSRLSLHQIPSGEVVVTDWARLCVCLSMSPSPSTAVQSTFHDAFL